MPAELGGGFGPLSFIVSGFTVTVSMPAELGGGFGHMETINTVGSFMWAFLCPLSWAVGSDGMISIEAARDNQMFLCPLSWAVGSDTWRTQHHHRRHIRFYAR